MRMSFWFIINFLIFLICLCESALTPEVKKAYSGLLSGKGLYSEDDGVVILSTATFKSKIYGTSNAWLVEFYNSWCGHCHKFAPIWKKLANNMREWANTVQLAAIDCSDDENTATCRDYDILAYPTVKFFPAQSLPSNLGTELKISHSESAVTKDLIGILQKEQLEGRGNRWPNIIPYRHYDTTNFWKGSDSVRYIFLIFTGENDPLASEVILDLSSVKNIEIRGVVSDNEVLSKSLGVRSYPSLLVLEKSGREPVVLKPEESNRESYRLAIKTFLRGKAIKVPDEPKPITLLSPEEMPSMIELQDARDAVLRLNKIKDLGDVVFLVDLENTIRYNLEHEISFKKDISGEALRALKNFLIIIAKYFPASESGIVYLEKLRDAILAEREINGSKFSTYLHNISAGGLEAIIGKKEEWIGCSGSEPHFRGFPCGMWSMFHYLTVNALRDSRRGDFNPLEVLEAMLGYVTHFFGCTDCSKHFQHMVQNRAMRSKVTNGDEAVLWLWAAHNEVNKRLSKDPTEDPIFPKIQFPSLERCPSCRDPRGKWHEGNVLKYLKVVYSHQNLNQMGSNTKLYSPSQSTGNEEENLNKSDMFKDESMQKIGKDFNIFDISLCVVLYVVSAVICVGVCLKFILKKRHGRKSHCQDLYGRV